MDYIWLARFESFGGQRRVIFSDCESSDTAIHDPDASVPLSLMHTANANPTILPSSSFPRSGVALLNYFRSQGAIREQPFGVLLDAVTGVSTTKVQEPLQVEQEWKQKGGGTRAEWKKAQEKGSILIRPLYTGHCVLKDVMVPFNGAQPLAQSGPQMGLYESASLFRTCAFNRKLWRAPGFPEGFVANSQESAFYRAFNGNYSLYDVTDVTTLFRLKTPPLRQFIEFLDSQGHPSGLVNPTLEKLNAGVYDVLTELAELTSTIQYIYSALRRIILAFIGMKSREVELAKKYGYGTREFIDELAGLWMSFRYAASPIAYSIQDAQKVLEAQQRVFITERGRKDAPFEFEADGYTFRGTLEWRCFAKARVEGPTVGLGLNPVRTLWEITPLAFVVGWVLPVGSMLSALMPPAGAKQTVASLSYRVRGVTITTQHDGRTYSVPNKIDIYKVTPIAPTAEFDLWPQVHFNWKRAIDSMALSWSMFLKQFWKSK